MPEDGSKAGIRLEGLKIFNTNRNRPAIKINIKLSDSKQEMSDHERFRH